ncbi:MAG: TonB family protein [Thermodesulfobacteriota bacterium]
MSAKVLSSWKEPSWEKQWSRMVVISLGLHLLALAFFLNVFPRGGAIHRIEPTYVVDLVSLPAGGPAGGAPKAETSLPAPPTKPNPITLPRPPAEKSLPVKEDPTKSLDQALEKIKKKVQQEKNLEKTLSRMEDRITREQTLERTLSDLEQKKKAALTSGQGKGGLASGDVSSSSGGGQEGTGIQFQLYYASLLSRIKRNWVLPEGLLKRKDISAVVMILVGRNGRIEDTRFERKSGVEAFDQEVLRTLKKSDPLPPLPEGYPRRSHEIFLTFYSKELSGN